LLLLRCRRPERVRQEALRRQTLAVERQMKAEAAAQG
jgi:hypothetical protein